MDGREIGPIKFNDRVGIAQSLVEVRENEDLC